MLDLLEIILWFLPDVVSIGTGTRSFTDDQRAFERRLAAFSAATLARQVSTSLRKHG